MNFFLTWADKLFLNADFLNLILLLILNWRTLLLKSPYTPDKVSL